MAVPAAIDQDRLQALEERENARFVTERPKSMVLLERSPHDAARRADVLDG